MPWKLTINIIEGPLTGERFEFVKNSVLIGRSKRADLAINDPAVSAEHCRIKLTEDTFEIEDLNSKNGTFVNQLPISHSSLKNQDRIRIGASEIELSFAQLTEKEAKSAIIYQNVFIAGYTQEERKILGEELKTNLIADETFDFATGEEALVEIIKWFEKHQAPWLLILDLKMPVINGINTAISLRAYERAYQRAESVPIVFFFDPPDTEAFRKVLSFCAPAMHYPRNSQNHTFEYQAQLLAKILGQTPVG